MPTPLCRTLLLVCLLVLPSCGVGGLFGDISGNKTDTAPGTSMSAAERAQALQVFALVNEVRTSNGLEPVQWDERAADCAYDHCVDMRLRNYYAHQTPDHVGPVERMEASGVDMSFFGAENIAKGQDTAYAVMAAWLNSPSHHEAIMGPGLTHLGVGVHLGADGPWWVQEFFLRFDE